MNNLRTPIVIATLALLCWVLAGSGDQAKADTSFPRFRMQEIETGLSVGYAVLLVDLNGDGKKDIVVADTTRVVWYENPTWKRRTITQGQAKPDNVCIAAHDIDGDGQLDLALGAGWKGLNSKDESPLYWLKRGQTLDEAWTLYPIGGEPSVHRIRFADVDGDGKPELIVSPLLGRNSTQAKNWMDGVPVRTLAYRIPKDPARDRWVPEVLDEGLHVVHNIWPIASATGKGVDILTASYEGVNRLTRDVSGKWTRLHLGQGNQDNPKSNRGASEIKQGRLVKPEGNPARPGRKSGDDRTYIATIEPWHGHQVVVYTPPNDPKGLWDRHVIDEQLKWGHGVWCADLDGDGAEELIIGVRDNLSDQPQTRRGVRIYKAIDGKGEKWTRQIIEDGGVAVEDLAAADLDNDGRIDIVAVGRATKNVRIYWNEGIR